MRGEFFRPGKPFAARYDWDGMLDRFDWLSRLADIPQEPAYHGEGDVLAHTAMVLDQLTGLDSWKELKISPSGKQHRVIQRAKDTARDYLRMKQPFVWNAANITRAMRKPLIDLFASYGAHVRIVYIEPHYQRLLEQNRHRMDRVPDHVIDHMIENLEVPAIEEAHYVDYIVD